MTQSTFTPIQFGRYVLEERLAKGGMAEIFRATSPGAHGFAKTLVIKRILPEQARNPKFVDWFIDEAKLMTRLDHPKIVQVMDFGEVEGRYFIAMEYVKGIDCLQLLRRCAKRRWRPSPIIAVHIIADVLDALHYAHNLTDSQGRALNLVHSDVSPSNIFVSEQGEVKLSDFGIATLGAGRERADSGFVRGKYGYLAPEVISGLPVDHRADIFSAGVCLAELLMVQRLFKGKNQLEVLLQVRDGNLERLEEFGAHISPDLRRILEYALARDAYLRYQNAAAFRDALHRYLYDRQQLLRSTSLRRFMHRMAAPSETLDAVSDAAGIKRPTPGLGVPGAAGPILQHGNRRILLGPPPQSMPVPSGPSRKQALARLSVGETVDRDAPFEGFQPAEDEFSIPESMPVPGLVDVVDRDYPVPEIEEAARLASTVNGELPRATPDVECDLSERSLVALLFSLTVNVETGLIVLRAGDRVKEIYLVDGDPQFVASNVQEELFGQFLLREGVISTVELERALRILPQFGGKLGEALVGLKLLRPMQVLRLLTHQIRQKVFNAFAWSNGIASYYRGQTCDREAAPLGLDAFELLEAGVAALPTELLVQRLAGAMGSRPLAVTPPPVPPEVFRVGGYPRQVYDRLTGQETLARLIQAEALVAPEDPRQVPDSLSRMIYLLLECGLAVLVA